MGFPLISVPRISLHSHREKYTYHRHSHTILMHTCIHAHTDMCIYNIYTTHAHTQAHIQIKCTHTTYTLTNFHKSYIYIIDIQNKLLF